MAGGRSGAAPAAGGRNILGARARVTKRVGNGKKALALTDGAGKENASHGAAGDGGEGGSGGGALAEAAAPGSGDGGAGVGGEEEEVEEVAVIRREDDFQGWLAQQKAGWRKHREQSRHKKHSDSRSEVQYLVQICARARRSGGFCGRVFVSFVCCGEC